MLEAACPQAVSIAEVRCRRNATSTRYVLAGSAGLAKAFGVENAMRLRIAFILRDTRLDTAR
jgi:hypothetical protein